MSNMKRIAFLDPDLHEREGEELAYNSKRRMTLVRDLETGETDWVLPAEITWREPRGRENRHHAVVGGAI